MPHRIPGFAKERFARRRALVLGALDDAVLILPAAPTLFRSRDSEHRYRPDSELFYLTGCTAPEVVAFLRGGHGGEAFILFVPRRDPSTELWSGPRMGPEEAGAFFGADDAFPLEEMDERLPGLLQAPRRVYFRLGAHSRVEGLVKDALRTARGRGGRKGIGPRGVLDPGELLDGMRLRKDPEEIAKIKQAAALTVAAFREAMASVRGGMGEWEVEGVLEGAFRRGGAQGPAFPTIVGSGGNGCTLHYSANEHTMEAGELVLLDGGAEVDLYSGDVTRTFPVGGAFNEVQRAVYEVVLGAHGAALEAVGPGRPMAGVHDAAVLHLTQGLVGLGVLKGDVEALILRKAYEPWFPHQTSHWLGLDVHDVGDYARNGESTTLEPGMVLTVEPGLYFPQEPHGAPGPYAGIGIRIEDDVLVTEDGRENLTQSLPVAPEEVEALVGSQETVPAVGRAAL